MLAFITAQQEQPLQYRIDIIIKLQIKRCSVDKDHLLELSVTATQEELSGRLYSAQVDPFCSMECGISVFCRMV